MVLAAVKNCKNISFIIIPVFLLISDKILVFNITATISYTLYVGSECDVDCILTFYVATPQLIIVVHGWYLKSLVLSRGYNLLITDKTSNKFKKPKYCSSQSCHFCLFIVPSLSKPLKSFYDFASKSPLNMLTKLNYLIQAILFL